MMGIYLGLLLNQWQNNQSEKSLKKTIQTQIEQEVKENLKTLLIKNAYHIQSLRLANHYDSLKKDSLIHFFNHWEGLNPAFLKRTAFESANFSGSFKAFHYEEYHKISSLYTIQSQIEKVNELYINNFLNLLSNSGDDITKTFNFLKIYLKDIITNEKSLIKNYREWLKNQKKK